MRLLSNRSPPDALQVARQVHTRFAVATPRAIGQFHAASKYPRCTGECRMFRVRGASAAAASHLAPRLLTLDMEGSVQWPDGRPRPLGVRRWRKRKGRAVTFNPRRVAPRRRQPIRPPIVRRALPDQVRGAATRRSAAVLVAGVPPGPAARQVKHAAAPPRSADQPMRRRLGASTSLSLAAADVRRRTSRFALVDRAHIDDVLSSSVGSSPMASCSSPDDTGGASWFALARSLGRVAPRHSFVIALLLLRPVLDLVRYLVAAPLASAVAAADHSSSCSSTTIR